MQCHCYKTKTIIPSSTSSASTILVHPRVESRDLDKISMFQNMQEYTVTADTNIDDYVCNCTILADGTMIYRFSKEILAYKMRKLELTPSENHTGMDPR